jgi:hypothetical protein
MTTLENAIAKRLLTTSGAHCLHKELWLPILLVGFPDTCFLTFLEMSFTVWLVSDFVSTPFALKQQLGIYLFPYLRLVWGWWWSPGWKHVLFYCTHPQMRSFCRKYTSLFSQTRSQDVSAFLHQENNNLHLRPWTDFALWKGKQSYFLTGLGLFLVNLVNRPL